jgi:LacI family transcriptional regulator
MHCTRKTWISGLISPACQVRLAWVLGVRTKKYSKRFEHMMGDNSVNLKQLSEKLGLSQTTVSRALNGYPEVSEATRERVLKAAQQTGYKPNKAAQRLATGKAKSIGLVMQSALEIGSDPHFSEFLSGLAEEAVKYDFNFVMAPAAPDDEINAIKRLISSGYVDAIFLAHVVDPDPRVELLRSSSIPYLLHGRIMGDVHDYPYLDVDNEGAFYTAAKLLLQLGHRRFALLNGVERFTFAMRRKIGVEKALGEAGIALRPEMVQHSVMSDQAGFRGMERFLAQRERPTAVLCASTALALGAVRAINKAGLKLGHDISLIAHDDVLTTLRPESFSVPLTTTRSSLRAAGARIARRLISKLEGLDDMPFQELWETELIVRASTGPAPDSD